MLSRLASRVVRPAATTLSRRSSALCAASTAVRAFAAETGGSKKLWGGRFTKDTNKNILAWIDSIPVDRHLQIEDTWGSIAHNAMLGSTGCIPATSSAAIMKTLLDIQNGMLDNTFTLGTKQDDVHMDVEANVIERLGMDVGGRMHVSRSRNDQVIVDSKLYARRRLLELRAKTIAAARSFITKAESDDHLNNVMVAYTHVQHAQPVSVAYWLTHYASVVIRDLDRLKHAYDTTDENPLGSGAIAGTSFPIDRNMTTKLLGFQKVHEHGLDATSSRDFFLESLSAAATLYTTWSRLAEELILWSSYEFRSVSLDDGFAMGSSMMPQKKNPGSCELIRGRAGRVNGLLSAGFTMMKGLPSGYNRDFHEDKEILVSMFDIVNSCTHVIPPLVETTKLNLPRLAELPQYSFSTATELANYLVSKHNTPFRAAHHIVGSLVGELSRAGQDFSTNRALCVEHLKKNGINAPKAEVDAVLEPKTVMQSYNSLGGTGPKAVSAMITKMKAQLAKQEAELAADQARVDAAYQACRNIAKEAATATTREQLAAVVAKYMPK